MRFFKISILFLFFSLNLLATTNLSYQQVLIAKTSKIKTLYTIKKRLSLLKIGIIVKKSNNKYLVYSKKFRNPKYAKYVLQKVTKSFPHAIIISHYKNKKGKKSIVVKTAKNSSKQQEKNNFFIDIGVGLTTISGETSDYLASKINNDDTTYSLEAGYFIDDNIFTTITYLNSFTTDISLDNLYLTLNYQYNIFKKTDIYLGGLFGVSLLRFEQSLEADNSTSLAVGWQTGIKYNIYNSLDLFLAYEGIKIDHNVDIKTTEYIKLTYIHNLNFGLIYRF